MRSLSLIHISIKNRLGGQVYEAVCYAAASVHPEKGTAIFYLLRRALEKGRIDTRVLELLAPHFSDRFPNENWMIYDKKRQKVLAHEQGGECTVYIQAVLNTQEMDPVPVSYTHLDVYKRQLLWQP